MTKLCFFPSKTDAGCAINLSSKKNSSKKSLMFVMCVCKCSTVTVNEDSNVETMKLSADITGGVNSNIIVFNMCDKSRKAYQDTEEVEVFCSTRVVSTLILELGIPVQCVQIFLPKLPKRKNNIFNIRENI